MDSSPTLSQSRRRLWLSAVAAVVATAALVLALAPSTAQAQTATLPPALQQAVRVQLGAQVGVDPGTVQIRRTERVVWADGCLGIPPQTGTACTQAQVSGWIVWASANNLTNRYHTNYTGTTVRLAQSGVADFATDPLPQGATRFQSNVETLPEGIATAVTALAATRATVTAENVEILRVQAVNWEDACVGAAQADEACAEVITPGYVVWLRAGTNVYRYHTGDATNIRFGEGNLSEGDVPLFELPAGATASQGGETPGPDGLISGDVPMSGFGLLQVTAATTPPELLTALVAQGCAPVSIAVTQQGSFITYIPGAPAFVNAAFPTSMEAGAAFAVRCA